MSGKDNPLQVGVTLIFATYNGSRTLPTMLEGLLALDLNGINLQVIAVDNNSNDGSRDLLFKAAQAFPIQVLDEVVRGKNKALNRAIELTRGDLVFFTDDDVVLPSNWLHVLIDAAQCHPQYSLFGGRIEALWPRTPEPWILEGVPKGAAFAISETTWSEGEINPAFIWGPNMMVRRSLFDVGHRFSVDVGPNQGNYIMGSETEFTRRMAALGHRCWFTPRAVVGHIIREHQLDRTWLAGRAFRYGRSLCANEVPLEVRDSTATVLGLPRWQVRAYLACRARATIAGLLGNEVAAMRNLWDAEVSRGFMAQWRAE